jgi:integrase
MECFFCRRDRAGEERWWLEITGKGNKTRIVPATNELMVELARYRRELKLPPLPLSGETAPLLFPIGGRPTPPAIRFRDMAILCHISALYFASLPCQQSLEYKVRFRVHDIPPRVICFTRHKTI